jgi:multicomponent Na+:H+ antiporter subunit C
MHLYQQCQNILSHGVVVAQLLSIDLFITEKFSKSHKNSLFFQIKLQQTLIQQAIPVLEACVFATILCGFFGIILKKNLVMKIISMDVMSTGVIAYYVLIASRDGLFTPIFSDVKNVAYSDPVPQAVILTAIVIGFSIQALMLVGVMKLARDNPTLESNEIEKNNTP